VNVKFTQSLDLIPSASASVPSISYAKSESSITAVAAAESSISVLVYLPPLIPLQTQEVTAIDVLSPVVVTKPLTELLPTSDALAMDFTLPSLVSSVVVDSAPSKIFNSSVDFDMSDVDVDPDPVTATDVVDLVPGKGETDEVTIGDVVDLVPGRSLSSIVTAASSVVNQPNKPITSAAVTIGDVVDVVPGRSLSSALTLASSSSLESVKILGSDVTISSVPTKIFASSVDFDMSDDDVDPDPVAATDVVVIGPRKSVPDPLTATDSDVKSIANAPDSSVTAASSVANQPNKLITSTAVTIGDVVDVVPGQSLSNAITMASLLNTFHYNKNEPDDAVTAGDSIVTTHTLGAQTRPLSQVFMSDGESGFIHTPRSIDVPCYDDLLGNVHSLVNAYRLYSDECADSTRYEAHTGTIGAPGLVNEPIMNDGLITYPDSSGAGFVVDFHYPTLTIGNYMANIALIN